MRVFGEVGLKNCVQRPQELYVKGCRWFETDSMFVGDGQVKEENRSTSHCLCSVLLEARPCGFVGGMKAMDVELTETANSPEPFQPVFSI